MVVAKGGKLLVAHPALSLGWKVRKQGSCRLQAFQGLCVARSTARLLPPTSPTAGPPHACTVLPCLAWLGTLHQGFPTGRAMHCCLCYMHGFMLLLQMNKGFTGTAVGCQQLNSTSVTSTFWSLLFLYRAPMVFLPRAYIWISLALFSITSPSQGVEGLLEDLWASFRKCLSLKAHIKQTHKIFQSDLWKPE